MFLRNVGSRSFEINQSDRGIFVIFLEKIASLLFLLYFCKRYIQNELIDLFAFP